MPCKGQLWNTSVWNSTDFHRFFCAQQIIPQTKPIFREQQVSRQRKYKRIPNVPNHYSPQNLREHGISFQEALWPVMLENDSREVSEPSRAESLLRSSRLTVGVCTVWLPSFQRCQKALLSRRNLSKSSSTCFTQVRCWHLYQSHFFF